MGYRRFGKVIEKVLIVARLVRARRINRDYSDSSKRVFDSGCGRGEFLKQLAKYGWEAHGSEVRGVISPSEMDPKVTLHIVDVTNPNPLANFQNESLSLISSFHNLEHLDDPIGFLHFAQYALKKHGFLIIEVPNIASFQANLAKESWIHLDTDNHNFHFSNETLRNALALSKFTIQSFRTFSIQYGVFGLIDSFCAKILRIESPFDLFQRESFLGKLFAALMCLILFLPCLLAEALLSQFGKGGVCRVVAKKST